MQVSSKKTKEESGQIVTIHGFPAVSNPALQRTHRQSRANPKPLAEGS